MRWDEIESLPCSVARSLAVVGDRWTLLLLRDAFLGRRRFDEFERSLRLSPHVLSTRLAKLVEHGMLERVAYQERPVRYAYELTERGRDFYPVIASLLRWGDRWLAGDEGPPVAMIHRPCGCASEATLVCSSCGDPLQPADVRPVPSPAAKSMFVEESNR